MLFLRKHWNRERTQEEAKNDILDWGESDEEIYATSDEENEDEHSYHEEEGISNISGSNNSLSSSSTSSSISTPTPPSKRITRAPTYLQDYTSGGELSEEETHNENLLLFMALNDPIYYEEAVKMKRWRDAMDIEMGAIKKKWNLGACLCTGRSQSNRGEVGLSNQAE